MTKKRYLALLLVLLSLFAIASASAGSSALEAFRKKMNSFTYDDFLAKKVSLKKGSKGDNVASLVAALCKMNYDAEISISASHDKYDSDVIKMVKSFQGMHFLKMTGNVGPELYAKICAQKDSWNYDKKRMLVSTSIYAKTSRGEALVGFDMVNCSTKYTVDAYDFVLTGTNMYGDLVFDETYYSNEKCSIGPFKMLSGNKKYFILPVCEEVPKIKFAITRFHTKELGTIDVPRSEWRWINCTPPW